MGYAFLNHNFDRHYTTNRAPLGLLYHAAWLKNNPEMLDSFLFWIDETLSKYDDSISSRPLKSSSGSRTPRPAPNRLASPPGRRTAVPLEFRPALCPTRALSTPKSCPE